MAAGPTAETAIAVAMVTAHSSVTVASISAIVSVFSVVSGFILNGVLQRAADQRKLDAERAREAEKIEHEKNTLRAALSAELQSLINTYIEELEFSTTEDFTWVPVIDFFGVYKNNINRLGYLSPGEVNLVTLAYYVFQERIGYIARNGIGDSRESDTITARNVGYSLQDAQTKDNLLHDLYAIVVAARNARDEISKQRGLGTSPDNLNTRLEPFHRFGTGKTQATPRS